MPKPYHLFISYASEDEEYAARLEKALRWRGLKVWFAPLSLVVGDKLLDSINAGLIASEYGVILVSAPYILKSWTNYELDVLHRQHIEKDKKLFLVRHGVDKEKIDAWNPGLSGIVWLNSTEDESAVSEKIANVVYQGSPVRAVTPSWEDPQWRFLRGQSEMLINNEDGPAFHLFEAAEFPDNYFPLYVFDRPYSKKEIISAVASALYYRNPDTIQLAGDRRKKMKALCKKHGYDLDSEGFDPAIDCVL
jgi:hypothetical protein